MDAIKEAQELYKDALDCLREQRIQIEEDLRFSDPSDPDQWEPCLRQQRESDPGGQRPCLVFDQTGQYVANVAGNVQQQPPALHSLPVGGGADRKVSEQLDGFFRHVEHTSRAQQHYTRALTSAARTGVGYLTVRPDYVNRALNWQEPRIGSEGDPLRVVFDPWSVELDGSDAQFGYILTPFSVRAFERQFGKKAEKKSFADDQTMALLQERDSILVAEQWRKESKTQNIIVCLGIDGDEMAIPEDDYWKECQRVGVQLQVVRTYKDKIECVKWARMSGAEQLDEEVEYQASGIGIVPVYGYVGWVDGRMTYCGIPRRAMHAQRAYNLHMSEMQAIMGQAAKAPYMLPLRAIADGQIKALWDRASVDNRAFMPYADFDENGPINKPERMQPGVNLQNHIAGAQQALTDIQASIGMYQANLGAPSNESSGVAIDARKQQGEASTAHFPGNLAASLGQVGRLVMEMIPRLMDSKRQLRVLSIDNTPGEVTIDPKQSQAVQETDKGLSINPNVGRYDVRIVVGASYSTQRTQAQAALSEVMRNNPDLTPVIAPIWASNLDIPHADKLAQVLAAVAPPEVKAILDPSSDKQPKTADLMAKIQQLQQGLDAAVQEAHAAQQEIDELQAEKEAREEENAIKAYDAYTKRLSVTGANVQQIEAIVKDMVNGMLTSPNPLGDEQPSGDAWQAQQFPAEMDGPGPSESAMHEQAEAPQFEQQEQINQMPEMGEEAI
jgi:hypothetical protein